MSVDVVVAWKMLLLQYRVLVEVVVAWKMLLLQYCVSVDVVVAWWWWWWLAIEIYKVKQQISPEFIGEIFPPTDIAYNLRNTIDFKRTKVNTVLWGSETIRYIGPII